MAYVHFKVRKRESADEILKDVLSKYKDEIIAYDVEEYGREVLPQANTIIEVKKASKKGGSLSVTIPKRIKKYLGLQKDDLLLFMVRKRIGRVYIEKVKEILERSNR